MNLSKSAMEREKDTLRKMINLYCRNQHRCDKALCEDCRGLLNYACKRLDLCRFGADKPTCGKCPVHCYKPDLRERVKKIMRYAGPRMIFYHPLDAVRHFIKNKKRAPVN
ncbi:MAG: nitrous oxide-stimulated promoter family protein [Desulfotomaculaceae bacterium]|nr:nitrous oxide-stimulated promoter family protein [Desulfotomaculaceae bacterium]